MKRAKLLISLAKSSVGTTQALRQLEQIEHGLHTILEPIPYAKTLLEIQGIHVTNLAGILGEAGDLSGYSHGNALLRHTGLNLAEA